MVSFKTKIRWSVVYAIKVLKELFIDLWRYYVTAYPFLLILGAYRRVNRRLKIIWLPNSKGRPPIHLKVVDLILDMKRCNQQWGGQRISDELALMGIRVSKKTVLKILKEYGFIPPKTRFTPPSWQSILHSMMRHWAMDFTSVFDGSGIQLFIFSIIEIPSRKLILINSTANPTKQWLMQQFRNCCIRGHSFPEIMVHDRDAIYGHWLPDALVQFDCQSFKTEPRSPWQNPFIERFHLSIKTEMLDRVIIADNNHVRELCLDYQDYYNDKRPHQGIDGDRPSLRLITNENFVDIENLQIEKTKELNGLVTHFKIAV